MRQHTALWYAFVLRWRKVKIFVVPSAERLNCVGVSNACSAYEPLYKLRQRTFLVFSHYSSVIQDSCCMRQVVVRVSQAIFVVTASVSFFSCTKLGELLAFMLPRSCATRVEQSFLMALLSKKIRLTIQNIQLTTLLHMVKIDVSRAKTACMCCKQSDWNDSS